MYIVNKELIIWHRLARTSASATSKSSGPWKVYVAVKVTVTPYRIALTDA